MRLSQRHSECCVDSFYLSLHAYRSVSVVCAVAICDTTGSAATLAARCRNFRRGSFIVVPNCERQNFNNSRCRLSNKASRLPMCAEGASDGSYWHKPAIGVRAEHVRSARVFQTSTCSACQGECAHPKVIKG